MRAVILLLLCSWIGAAAPPHKLLVISVDGLDWRYLRDRDQLNLKIPHLRHLLSKGDYADGVIGVWPTITWPSHTSLITGVRPDRHGILGNRRPRSEGGDYYWNVDFLKVPTLWEAVGKHGLQAASVTWPVTVGAKEAFDLPEYFQRRDGGSMDLRTIASKTTPGLVDDISRQYPSFPQQWMDDRTRTIAVCYLLQNKKPDLLLLHLVDLDSEEHDQGPFTPNANAILERTDQLIGQMLSVLPSDYDVALVSDHGFELVDKIANLRVLLARNNIVGELQPMGGIVTTTDPKVADFLRQARGKPENGIGREIPHDELVRFAPSLSNVTAAFEPAEHIMFGSGETGAYFTPPREKGNHGFWPLRHDYRSVFVLYGPGIQPKREGQIDMLSIASRLAQVLGFEFPEKSSKGSHVSLR